MSWFHSESQRSHYPRFEALEHCMIVSVSVLHLRTILSNRNMTIHSRHHRLQWVTEWKIKAHFSYFQFNAKSYWFFLSVKKYEYLYLWSLWTWHVPRRSTAVGFPSSFFLTIIRTANKITHTRCISRATTFAKPTGWVLSATIWFECRIAYGIRCAIPITPELAGVDLPNSYRVIYHKNQIILKL